VKVQKGTGRKKRKKIRKVEGDGRAYPQTRFLDPPTAWRRPTNSRPANEFVPVVTVQENF